ncbi:AzlD family protein [Acinetobacter terrestris]|uniref:AzlD family protein n=1 Tax=Acinetobacter terrestris TaxID=2529843 RepID=UPI00103D10E8|nr:AzlD domain-containing protein [Acinetobacter terrestris]TCB46875.1 AzlD family protein [Acinetobacter terrestris]
MIHSATLIAIVFIAVTTYLTRVLEVVPGCVLISVIAPYFVKDNPADLLAIVITLIAASRFSLLPTVLISMTSAAILRFILI